MIAECGLKLRRMGRERKGKREKIIIVIIIISFLPLCRNFSLSFLAVAKLINYFAFLLSDCLKIWSSLPPNLNFTNCPSFGYLRTRNSYLPTAKGMNKI